MASTSYILNTKYWILNIAEPRTNSPEGQVVSHQVARIQGQKAQVFVSADTRQKPIFLAKKPEF